MAKIESKRRKETKEANNKYERSWTLKGKRNRLSRASSTEYKHSGEDEKEVRKIQALIVHRRLFPCRRSLEIWKISLPQTQAEKKKAMFLRGKRTAKTIHVQQQPQQQPIQSEKYFFFFFFFFTSSLDENGNLRSQTNYAVQDKE